ncbi:MAG: SagB/ThcOx family dehydrogenase [Lentisphaeria bacterium]|nr:SagB/ThcOx family dehydrogenase [Lentisphaeria bacterium]
MALGRDEFRYVLRDSVRREVAFAQTDQNRGLPAPPVQKPCGPGARLLSLPEARSLASLARLSLWNAVSQRESRRAYGRSALTLEELAWLLWATQGVKATAGISTLRTVPSAGARHPLETYVFVFRVRGMEPGLYRYLPLDHALCFEYAEPGLDRCLGEACLGQDFVGRGAATFAWTAIPYRTEWRYGLAAARVILLDAGHVCQNLYLACEAIRCGTCAIGAYDQDAVDRLLRVDGRDEFAVYLAPVGRKAE